MRARPLNPAEGCRGRRRRGPAAAGPRLFSHWEIFERRPVCVSPGPSRRTYPYLEIAGLEREHNSIPSERGIKSRGSDALERDGRPEEAAVTFMCAPCGCEGRGALLCGEACYEGRVPIVTCVVFVVPLRTYVTETLFPVPWAATAAVRSSGL